MFTFPAVPSTPQLLREYLLPHSTNSESCLNLNHHLPPMLEKLTLTIEIFPLTHKAEGTRSLKALRVINNFKKTL